MPGDHGLTGMPGLIGPSGLKGEFGDNGDKVRVFNNTLVNTNFFAYF